MTEVGADLRALIIRARRDPERWGKPRGLSQAELAARAGTSEVWLRQIETGQASSASADTLGCICYELGIDSLILHALGYADVAGAIDASVMLKESAIPEHLTEAVRVISPEEHIRGTPGISARGKRRLVEVLHEIQGQQPA